PTSVVGPDDFTASAFGTLCKRFWRGRLPLHFGGGNNFVDVRDVATGHLLAAEHGRAGQRYLLGGTNRTFTAFFGDWARVARRPIPRLRMPDALGRMVAALAERFRKSRSSRPSLTPGQARMLSLFFFCNCSKARRELGYEARPLANTLQDAHAFWMS